MKKFVFALLFLTLTACVSPAQPIQPAAATNTAEPQASPTLVVQLTPAATLTPIPTPLPSSSPVITQEISRTCLVTDKKMLA
jgi:hypothetical protein